MNSLRVDAPVNHLGNHILQKVSISMTSVLHLNNYQELITDIVDSKKYMANKLTSACLVWMS